MRIAVVNNFFPPRVGGSSHLSEELAIQYARAGHQVLVITAAYEDAAMLEKRDGIGILRLPAVSIPETRFALNFDISFTTRPSLPFRLSAMLKKFAPDVIHQHGQFFDLSWATGQWARHARVPVLLSVHTRLENPTALYSSALRLLDKGVVNPILHSYKPRMVVMDRLMDDYIHDVYRHSYSGLEYIPVGVDLDAVHGGDPHAAYDRLGLEPGTPIILSIGHVIPLRDRMNLIEAMPIVLREVPRARLVVVGRVYYDRFLRRADELGIESHVIATGAVSRADVADYLAAATVESHEQGYGLGTSSLEAMAAGVPVVAPIESDNFPTIPLINETHAYLCQEQSPQSLAESLIQALTNHEQAQQVGEAGQKLIEEHFSIERIAAQHLNVFESMISENRKV